MGFGFVQCWFPPSGAQEVALCLVEGGFGVKPADLALVQEGNWDDYGEYGVELCFSRV